MTAESYRRRIARMARNGLRPGRPGYYYLCACRTTCAGTETGAQEFEARTLGEHRCDDNENFGSCLPIPAWSKERVRPDEAKQKSVGRRLTTRGSSEAAQESSEDEGLQGPSGDAVRRTTPEHSRLFLPAPSPSPAPPAKRMRHSASASPPPQSLPTRTSHTPAPVASTSRFSPPRSAPSSAIPHRSTRGRSESLRAHAASARDAANQAEDQLERQAARAREEDILHQAFLHGCLRAATEHAVADAPVAARSKMLADALAGLLATRDDGINSIDHAFARREDRAAGKGPEQRADGADRGGDIKEEAGVAERQAR